MADSDKAFIGIKPCGCVVFALVAGHGSRREEERELAQQMKAGLTIEVTTVGEARPRIEFNCQHGALPANPAAEAKRLVSEARGSNQQELPV